MSEKVEAEAEFDLGIDVRVARELRELILGDTTLPPSSRSSQENRDQWSRQDLITYGTWLAELLELDASQTLTAQHVARASKLDLGPSIKTIEYQFPDNLTGFQNALGARGQKAYMRWTRAHCIEAGVRLAQDIRQRPGEREVEFAHATSDFPGLECLIGKFGLLSNFQEAIGFPNPRGWTTQDYMEWGAAFKRQNGPDQKINSNALRYLSKKGRGPSRQAVRKNIGLIADLDVMADKEYWLQLDQENEDRDFIRVESKKFLEANPDLERALGDLSEEEKLQACIQYRLAVEFVPGLNLSHYARASRTLSPDAFTDWVLRSNPKTSVAQIEVRTSEMRAFGVLWPMYRFDNVDLRLPQAA